MTDYVYWHSRFGELATEVETVCFITRAVELQSVAVERLRNEIEAVRELNVSARDVSDENAANFFLALECMLTALLHEVMMWQLLKQEQPDEAWEHLVSAQDALADAPRAHGAGNRALARVPWLADVERVVFPPQIFMSPGFVTRGSTCSLCGKAFEDCNHIAGRAYMGQFCRIVHGEFEAQEISFVTIPADKRSRVTSILDGVGVRNRMTWRVQTATESAVEDSSLAVLAEQSAVNDAQSASTEVLPVAPG